MRPVALLLGLCLIPCLRTLLHRCPPSEDLHRQCLCQKIRDQVLLKCRNLNNSHQLSEALSSLKDYVVDGLVVSDSGPLEMAAGPFVKLNVHRLTFKRVGFSIFPAFSALQGTDRVLEELSFDNCSVSEWIWSSGSHFAFLESITFGHTDLPEILEPRVFQKFPRKIKKLVVVKCGVKKMLPDSLKTFTLLKELKVEDNGLTSLTRNVLPFYLPKLFSLSFRGNPLEDLPDDMFARMPRLEFLYLGDTRLRTLRIETFRPVWEQLEKVFFNNLRLKCDCSSAWLVDVDPNKMPKGPFCLGKPMERVTLRELCPA